MKILRMVCAVYLPMEDGETQDQAEERALELIENAGARVYSWWNAETIDDTDDRKDGESE